jgi:hypothetical protein
MTTGKDHVKSTCWNVLTEGKIEPPIQTDFSLRRRHCHIFILLGARAVISLLILSAMPGNMVVPPLRTYNVATEILPDINITFHDRVVGGLMDARSFHPNQRWLEKHFWASEPFYTNCDDIRQLIALLDRGAALSSLELKYLIISNEYA